MNDRNWVQREFTITRLLDAPRTMVFKAWTDPQHLRWFFADGTPAEEQVEVDLRVGGVWRLKMIENAAKQYFTGGTYREIVPPERLVFTWGVSDGWPALDPERIEDSPVVTVTLTEVDRKTEMLLHVRLPDHLSEAGVREWLELGIREGWGATIDRLVDRYAVAV